MSRQTDMERILELLSRPPAACRWNTGEVLDAPRGVFRVEMPNGKGPFNAFPDDRAAGDKIYEVLARYGADRRAVENNERMGLTGTGFFREHGGAHYGFASLAAVADWFVEDARRYLRDRWGASLVEYEVPAGESVLEVGHGEVIFNKSRAKRVAEHDLVDTLGKVCHKMAA